MERCRFAAVQHKYPMASAPLVMRMDSANDHKSRRWWASEEMILHVAAEFDVELVVHTSATFTLVLPDASSRRRLGYSSGLESTRRRRSLRHLTSAHYTTRCGHSLARVSCGDAVVTMVKQPPVMPRRDAYVCVYDMARQAQPGMLVH